MDGALDLKSKDLWFNFYCWTAKKGLCLPSIDGYLLSGSYYVCSVLLVCVSCTREDNDSVTKDLECVLTLMGLRRQAERARTIGALRLARHEGMTDAR